MKFLIKKQTNKLLFGGLSLIHILSKRKQDEGESGKTEVS